MVLIDDQIAMACKCVVPQFSCEKNLNNIGLGTVFVECSSIVESVIFNWQCACPQVEVIGGVDKYMAVCRTCYTLPTHHHLTPTETTPIRGGDITTGRQLFPDEELL